MLWKKKTFENFTVWNAHTLHLRYMSMHLTLAKIKKLSFLLTFSNLDVYSIIHVYKITEQQSKKNKYLKSLFWSFFFIYIYLYMCIYTYSLLLGRVWVLTALIHPTQRDLNTETFDRSKRTNSLGPWSDAGRLLSASRRAEKAVLKLRVMLALCCDSSHQGLSRQNFCMKDATSSPSLLSNMAQAARRATADGRLLLFLTSLNERTQRLRDSGCSPGCTWK